MCSTGNNWQAVMHSASNHENEFLNDILAKFQLIDQTDAMYMRNEYTGCNISVVFELLKEKLSLQHR